MYIESIQLYNFRNYDKLELAPHRGTSVIYGKNGSGKTNLLEAVHFSCFGRSQRSRQDRDMMRLEQSESAVKIRTRRCDGRHEVELRMRYQGRLQKSVLVYGKRVERISEMFGHSTCVLFSPEDMDIIKGGPTERRRFMDMQLSQMRPTYLNALSDYIKALKSRNILLKSAAMGRAAEAELEVWEQQMARRGAEIVQQRQWFLSLLNEIAAPIYRELSGSADESFLLYYAGSLKQDESPMESLLHNLKSGRATDIRRQQTSFGPHRDDMDCRLNGHPMKEFASQGQMRTAVLAMKLAMIRMIQGEMGELPILLLDDVFSELDLRRRRALLGYIKNIQSFITCTDKSDLADAHVDCFLHVENIEGKARLRVEK